MHMYPYILCKYIMILEKVKLNIAFWGFQIINEVKFLHVWKKQMHDEI